MTNHWSSQPRHQSQNHTTLTHLEDLQSFTNLHQTTVSRVPLVNFRVRSGVVAMFCPEYCTKSPVVYGVIQATSAIVLPLSINMQWLASTTYVPSMYRPTHHGPQKLSFLPKKPYVSKVWRGKYHLQHRKHHWSKEGSSSHNVFFCMDLTTRNTQT